MGLYFNAELQDTKSKQLLNIEMAGNMTFQLLVASSSVQH